jgi:outer membrane protein assembly factor BamB
VLNFNAEGLFSHDSTNGRVVWNVPWVSNPHERNNVCQPVPCAGQFAGGENCVFLASGYGMGCAVVEITRDGEQFSVRERWRNRNLKAKFASAVVRDGYVYGLDGAILTCVDLATGKRQWKEGHYGYGQLTLGGSHLVIQLESGEVALVEATPQGRHEVARFAALADRTWNHPVVASRHLLVRNDREAACYELPLAK